MYHQDIYQQDVYQQDKYQQNVYQHKHVLTNTYINKIHINKTCINKSPEQQSIIRKIIMENYLNIDINSLQDEANTFGDQFIQTLLQLKDNHKQEDQQWFQKLLELNSHNLESIDINAGLLINFTVLDSIIAKLLNFDLKLLAKIRVVGAYINQLWESNGGDITKLNDFIICEDQARELSNKVNLPITPTNSIPTIYTCPTLTQNLQQETDTSLIAKPISNLVQNKTEQEDIFMYEKEVELQEIEMLEAKTSELETQNDDDNTKDNMTTTLLKDIKESKHYKTRNRSAQTPNPFFITNKGAFTAGILIANTPGDSKQEQKTYLANMLRLSKPQISLIKNLFSNGNGWYTINFQYQHDMINCVQKLNNKNEEDFKLIYITGGPDTLDPKQKIKEAQINKPQATKALKQEKIENIKTEKNLYNLNATTTQWGIKMLIGTFPGNNRNEQITILADTFDINKSSNLISIEHINGNSWFTGYFKNEQERSACLIEINKTSSNTGIKALKIDETSKRNNNKANIQTSKGKNTLKHDEIYTKIQDAQVIQVKILDIPPEFTHNRVLGALKKYGQIKSLSITKEEKGKRTASVFFNNIKLDLENTWSIPMGDVMARIFPAEQMHLVTERNSITTRLYGIHNNTTATRIMNAIKHMKAKSIYIPQNSKTGKRRNFAIISFQDQENLEKAIKSHVELFGCKTWWSRKDLSKVKTFHNRSKSLETNFQQTKNHQYNISESSYESEDSSSTYSENSYYNNYKHKKPKVKLTSYTSRPFPIQHKNSDWSQMTNLLERIDNRLNRLEESELKRSKSGPSAHNRS